MQTLPITADEAALLLHALRHYMSAKGNEISNNTRTMEKKLNDFLDGTTFVANLIEAGKASERLAAINARFAASKLGQSRSEAKKAAARENGQKGGRPRKNPSLPTPRAYSVWCELHVPRIACGEARKLKQGDLICERPGCHVRAVYSF